ncbi:DNA-directed RNA polymerase sigma factor 30 [Enterococcus florum]|uniref:RNA polymerase sigma factor SigS n=1 Tax=Enterococcus florum TaxID=2480627 RepID=A0A4V0WPK7_9ENTE|nr:sigma-70 family RNA polymerase sigma factor [Enterococcus florum]GCF94199.1 DNA-directed RNA polymerase sigma factor 30 [Enterococcus florum]
MDLVSKVKTGDEEALRELFDQYVPVVFNLKAKFFVQDYDLDDWLQEGLCALYDAARTYRSDQNTTFGLYFKKIFENRVRSLLRKQEAKKRKAQRNPLSIEKEGIDYLAEQMIYNSQIEEQLIINEILQETDFQLSSLEAEVLKKYLQGTDIAAIAQERQMELRTIKNALLRAKRKIKKELSYQIPKNANGYK